MPEINLSREELYNLVWAEPVSRLAKRYGLSDYQFRQLCIRLSIPMPRQGHWNKQRAGEQSGPPPLPPNFKGDSTVRLSAPEKPKNASPAARPAAVLRTKPTPEDLLITAARAKLKTNDKRWLDNGLTWTKGKVLRIGVAPQNIDRACQFMAALLKEVGSRGYRIEVKEDQTSLHIGYQPLPIVLREKTRRVTVKEHGRSWTSSRMEPYGDLYLQMTYQFKERQWKIGDGALPDEAQAMLERLEAASQRVDEYYRDLERRWAENDARRKAEQARQDRQKAELTGFKRLLHAATRWQQAEWIRNYLTTMETREAAASPGGLTPDRTAWFAWARAKADWFDPLTETSDEWLAHVDRNTLEEKKTYGAF
jgi:hypothetical protein